MSRILCCLILLFLVKPQWLYAQDRLMNRYTILSDDKRCRLSSDGNWRLLLVPNGTLLNVTNVSGASAEYIPAFEDYSGNLEVMIYKYKWNEVVDKKVKVEIKHAGRTEEKYVDLSTVKDGWYSLGKFKFDSRNDESVRFTRISKDASLTPVPMIRFDLYYDTQTRQETEKEKKQNLPLGYSETGEWQISELQGYNKDVKPRESYQRNATCIWNPGELEKGKHGVYLFKPNVAANDRYEVYHNGKVDVVYLKNLKFSNLDLYNPVTKTGWYKIGEFDFSGKGNEYIKLIKEAGNFPSIADCIYFENVKFDGTILNRTVVTTKKTKTSLTKASPNLSLPQKEKLTKLPVGFSPTLNEEDIQTSSKFGSTIYSRAYFIKNTARSYFWNPCIVAPGEYEILYYNYWETKGDGVFKIIHSNKTDVVQIQRSQFVKDSFLSLGTYFFTGCGADEYLEMTGIDRASDITFQKRMADGALLKQVVVTGHPYFKELSFADTRGIDAEHAISFLIQKGLLSPPAGNKFLPFAPITVHDFLHSLRIILHRQKDDSNGGSNIAEKDVLQAAMNECLLYNLPSASKLASSTFVNREMAAQFLMNAMEISGKYLNVKNLFNSPYQEVLSKYKDYNKVSGWAQEALAKAIETEVVKRAAPGMLNPSASVSRASAAIMLKDFFENILGSGPPSQWDWELTFHDEFNGDGVDWAKWKPEAQVRFKGLSAKWGENCVVEDGILKGYTYMDNRNAPYSSGCVSSRFSQQHGFFEARYKYPDRAYGSHTSFWTSSKGGDFNYNEGTYPNGVSNNNYFMTTKPVPGLGNGKQANFNNFNIPTNFAHDFHTISGFLDEKDLAYGLDGKVTYAVNNYPNYYKDSTRTTNVPYSLIMSTVITYFDGPLDRDRIDGSYMAVDWVRAYKKITWKPEFLPQLSFPLDGAGSEPTKIEPILRFNKPLNKQNLTRDMISVINVNSGEVPSYTITQITPLRAKITFNNKLNTHTKYQIKIKAGITDTRGNNMENDRYISFTTGAK